jgi:hypothetical protein
MKPGAWRMDIKSLKRQASSFRAPGTKVLITQGVRHNVARQFVAG